MAPGLFSVIDLLDSRVPKDSLNVVQVTVTLRLYRHRVFNSTEEKFYNIVYFLRVTLVFLFSLISRSSTSILPHR